MSHIIDADKLLEFVEEGMRHSKLCSGIEPVTQNGEYDVVSDIIRRMDLFTHNQLKLIKDYIIENRI
jgi:hypothetical protein